MSRGGSQGESCSEIAKNNPQQLTAWSQKSVSGMGPIPCNKEVNEKEYKPGSPPPLFHAHLPCPYFPTSPFSLLLEVLQIV